MRAELLRLPGLLDVKYHAESDFFSVRYETVLVTRESIYAAVVAAGKKMGREYSPAVID